jgi:hypothetical protein
VLKSPKREIILVWFVGENVPLNAEFKLINLGKWQYQRQDL